MMMMIISIAVVVIIIVAVVDVIAVRLDSRGQARGFADKAI